MSEIHTLENYRKQITIHKCEWCGEDLDIENAPIDFYEHDGGWLVWTGENFKKWWLSIHCDKCGYDWSLWKLGVPRCTINLETEDCKFELGDKVTHWSYEGAREVIGIHMQHNVFFGRPDKWRVVVIGCEDNQENFSLAEKKS